MDARAYQTFGTPTAYTAYSKKDNPFVEDGVCGLLT
jgi:hypothetical protein